MEKDYRSRTPRPTLPPLFLGALLLWIGCACALVFSRCADDDHLALIAVLAFLLAVSFAILPCIKGSFAYLILGAFLCSGLTLGTVQAMAMHRQGGNLPSTIDQETMLTLTEDSKESFRGEIAEGWLDIPEKAPMKIEAYLKGSEPCFYGDRFLVTGRLSPTDFNEDGFSWTKGVLGTLNIDTQQHLEPTGILGTLQTIRHRSLEALGDSTPERGVLAAILCGYRRAINGTDLYKDYQLCGVAHLIAVSGAHLIIVAGLITALLKLLRIPRFGVIITSSLVLGGYLILAGAPLSALRAALMAIASLFAFFGKRRTSSCNGLGLAILILILSDPSCALSLSFALSALATLGIVLFAPLMGSWFTSRLFDGLPAIRDGLVLTFASSLLAQPFATSTFSILPLICPLVNLLLAPLFSIICVTGLLGALLGAFQGPGTQLLLSMADILTGFMDSLITTFARLPFAAVPFTLDSTFALGLSALSALGLWLLWPGRRSVVLSCAGLGFLFTVILLFPINRDEIVMLDVGQGDAFLLRSQGHSLLIDTGRNDGMLKNSLARNRLWALDGLLITHSDDDHCGSINVIDDLVDVRWAYVAEGMVKAEEDSCISLINELESTCHELRGLKAGDRITFGAFTLTVLWPEDFETGGNEDSLCLWLSYDGDRDGVGDITGLFTGDAEKDTLRTLASEGLLGPVDILKVGHHGSANALDDELSALLNPQIALIGVGESNRYGHPSPETLKRLENQGTRILRTDRDGEVTCEFQGNIVSITKQS